MSGNKIYNRIAEILTDLYTKAGKLPLPIYTWTTQFGNYTYIEYVEWSNSFYYTGWEGDDDETSYKIYGLTPIKMKEAIGEVWEHLSEAECTELMATVLGQKNEL